MERLSLLIDNFKDSISEEYLNGLCTKEFHDGYLEAIQDVKWQIEYDQKSLKNDPNK